MASDSPRRVTFRVTAVARSADSPVGRVDGIDPEGRTIELETSSAALRGVTPGAALILEYHFEQQPAESPPRQFRELERLLSAKG